jgi:TonB-dependent starch-binding outer membrane protein SusC
VDQQGIMHGSGNERVNARLNLDHRATDWLDLSLGTSYNLNRSDLVINGEEGFGGLLTAIVFTETTLDLTERDPVTNELVNQGIFPNPLEVLENWRAPQEISRFVGSLQARVNPLPGVNVDYRLGYDRYEMETGLSIPRGSPDAPLGSSTSANRRNTLLNNDLVASYDFGAGEDARLTTSAGFNHTYQQVQQFNMSATDLVPFTRLVRGANPAASQGEIELVTLGFFGQQQLAWDNRLFLTGALRWDASSTFGVDERWQMYPKLSASWVLSEEGFWQASAMGDWFSELRLRTALGYAGNQPPLGAAYARTPRFGEVVNVNRLGLVPLATPGNPDLRPERQREWEVGFDAAVLDDRLALSFTYYDQLTEDLLLNRPFSPSTGYSSVLDNVGALSNKGMEVELSSVNVETPRFGWSTRLIYSRNRNVVETLEIQPFQAGYTNWVEEGYALGVHRMPAFERDDAGNIVEDEVGPVNAGQQIVGDPWPDFTASLANEFRIGGNWSASFLLDGAFGHDLWNQTQRIMDIFGAGPLYDRLLRGEVTAAERVRLQGIWEHYLEDASYIKLRDMTVRYSSDAAWLQRVGASSIQIEATARNLFTWTDYTGYDPEVNMFGLSTVERGTDFAVYPNPRTFGLGVRLTY